MLEQKKTAIDLTDLALGIVVLGIVASIGATILVGMRDARLTDLPTLSSTQTVNATNVTGTELSNAYFKGITTVINATGGETVAAGNYSATLNTVTGKATILFGTTSTFLNKNVNVTYTRYDTTQADYALANDSANGLAEYGNWFKIIVIVGVAAVILALIFMAFGRGANSVGQTY